MNVGLDRLRLAAALAHSTVDADVELAGPGRRWMVSYGRADAMVDPSAFRELVLAAVRGCPVPVLPAEDIRFVGGLREIGAGVCERLGEHGPERRFATFLSKARVHALLAGCSPDLESTTVRLQTDAALGVTVVTIAIAPAACELHLDAGRASCRRHLPRRRTHRHRR